MFDLKTMWNDAAYNDRLCIEAVVNFLSSKAVNQNYVVIRHCAKFLLDEARSMGKSIAETYEYLVNLKKQGGKNAGI